MAGYNSGGGVDYIDGRADIEALTTATEGQTAYALDLNRIGSYNGSTWQWDGVWVQNVAPANVFQGMMWYDTTGEITQGLLFNSSDNSMYLGAI